ncbi:MAG: hypothetical protein KC713_05500 [Candidatus Omnitrophica bacterium]|nr:hypothetical protein [Candidatus Omnitrophota bacterium]
MNIKQMLRLFVISFLLSGCATLEKEGVLTPQPTRSEYFHTMGAGFTLTARDPNSIKYIISLDVLKSREEDVFIEAQFENPSSPKTPIIVTYILQPEESSFTLQSPSVYGVKYYEGYVIDVFIYDDSTKTNLLGKHRQVVQSIIDQNKINEILKQKK